MIGSFLSLLGNGGEALAHFKEYVRLSNQLRGDEIRKAAQVETFDAQFAQQKALAKAEQEKREAVAKAELRQEQTKRYALYGGIALLVIFGAFMFNRFRVTQQQKLVIEKQKAVVETEKRRSDELLLNILPAEVAEELKEKGRTEAALFEQVTVMFTELRASRRLQKNSRRENWWRKLTRPLVPLTTSSRSMTSKKLKPSATVTCVLVAYRWLINPMRQML